MRKMSSEVVSSRSSFHTDQSSVRVNGQDFHRLQIPQNREKHVQATSASIWSRVTVLPSLLSNRVVHLLEKYSRFLPRYLCLMIPLCYFLTKLTSSSLILS